MQRYLRSVGGIGRGYQHRENVSDSNLAGQTRSRVVSYNREVKTSKLENMTDQTRVDKERAPDQARAITQQKRTETVEDIGSLTRTADSQNARDDANYIQEVQGFGGTPSSIRVAWWLGGEVEELRKRSRRPFGTTTQSDVKCTGDVLLSSL